MKTKNTVSRRTFLGRVGAGGIGAGGIFAASMLPTPALAAGSPNSPGWFNVRDFGAAGNSSTDDTPAIQSALAAAAKNHGGCVYFPTGNYKTTATLSLPALHNGMAICGDGNQSRILASGDYDIISAGSGNGENGLLIRDLYFQGPGAAASAGAAITLQSVSDFRIQNISSFQTGIGLNLLGTAFGRTANIENCFIGAARHGLYTQGGISAFGCSFGGGSIGAVLDSIGGACRFFGVSLYGPLSLATRNSLGAKSPEGLWCHDVECNWEPGANPPEGPGGMNLDWLGGEIHLVHCWATDNGITLGGNLSPRYVQITGGCYSGGAKQLPNAIHIKQGSNILINGAHLRGGGIVIDRPVSRFLITGCAFNGSQDYCIHSAATAGPNAIVGNTFEGWTSRSGPVFYPAASARAYTFNGNSAGPNT